MPTTYTVETRTDDSLATMCAPRVLSDHGADLEAAKDAASAASRRKSRTGSGRGLGCWVARMSPGGTYAVLLPDGTWTDKED
jgi:hypothetical protein